MAVTISAAELAEELGIELTPRSEPETRAGVTTYAGPGATDDVTRLHAVACGRVTRYAPDAPDALSDMAVVRFAGHLCQTADGRSAWQGYSVGELEFSQPANVAANAFRLSGAEALLSLYKIRNAGVIG